MIAFQKTAKITAKGQITLPKAVREVLHSDLVRIVVDGDEVRLEPVEEVGGALSRYATRYIPMEEAREEAWSRVADEDDPSD